MSTAEESGSALSRELGIERIDPTTFSVLTRRYIAIVDEMTVALENAAWTSILALARDFSCAVFDGETRLIAMHEGSPLHVSGMHVVLEEVAHRFEGNVRDGDVMICNDPYSGNSHVGDVVIAAPVFVGDELCFWSAVKVHHLDIGAPWPTSMPYLATDVWTEGITIPPLKIWDGGEFREDVFAMILANLRYPDQLRGDLLAQQGSVGVGKRGLLQTVERYGLEEVKRYTEAIRRYAFKRAGDEISTWPDGVYVGESWIDSDGRGTEDIYVRARVEIAGEFVHVDLTGSGPQAPGAVNSSYANSLAASGLPILECLDPDIPPHNRGCQDHVVINPGPQGTITNCRWPGSTAVDTALSGDVIQEAVWKALAQAIPDKVIGGVAKSPGVAFVSGTDARDPDREESVWGMAIFNTSGGGGASKGYDGWHQFVCYGCMGCLKQSSIEMMELLYPVVFEQLEIAPMSGGAGRVGRRPRHPHRHAPPRRQRRHLHHRRGHAQPAVRRDRRGAGVRRRPVARAGGPLADVLRQQGAHPARGRRALGLRVHGRRRLRAPHRPRPEARRRGRARRARLAASSPARSTASCCGTTARSTTRRRCALRQEYDASRTYEVTKPNSPRHSTWLQREMREGERFIQDSI